MRCACKLKLNTEVLCFGAQVRRSRCFKDAVALFSGKGHAVWRQPLKVTFVGEAGMDSGGVTREWFSTLSTAITRSSPELFYPTGPQSNQLYINPLSATPSHLKKFQFVGLLMAKAILESAARGADGVTKVKGCVSTLVPMMSISHPGFTA